MKVNRDQKIALAVGFLLPIVGVIWVKTILKIINIDRLERDNERMRGTLAILDEKAARLTSEINEIQTIQAH